MLRSLGLKCRHGGTYEDPVTAKTRQFDILAESAIVRASDYLQVLFAVECKHLQPHYPLVVHRLPRDRSESYLDVIMSKEDEYGYSGTSSYRFQVVGDYCPYDINLPVGKALDQIGKAEASGELVGSDQEVFDKMTQALNSSYLLLNEASIAARSRSTFVFSVIVPVVVVPDQTLWAIDYDEHGNVLGKPQQLTELSVFVGKEWSVGGRMKHPFALSHIEFVTPARISEFVSRWCTRLPFNAQELREFYDRPRSAPPNSR
jgi:hypothetical protein